MADWWLGLFYLRSSHRAAMRLNIFGYSIEVAVTVEKHSEPTDIDAPLTDEEQQQLDDVLDAFGSTQDFGAAKKMTREDSDYERTETDSNEDIATSDNRGEYTWE